MSADLTSRVYKPDASKCCDACVFGAKEHARWCMEQNGYEFNGLTLAELQDKLELALYTERYPSTGYLLALSEEIHRRSPRP